MSAITRPIVSSPNQLRPFDVGRDLSAVADLVEACFAETLDTDGRRYVQQMHAAARNPRYLRWAAAMADHVSMPLTGFVWEEHGQLVGNLSLIPFTYLGRRCYLIANVAVDPVSRRPPWSTPAGGVWRKSGCTCGRKTPPPETCITPSASRSAPGARPGRALEACRPCRPQSQRKR